MNRNLSTTEFDGFDVSDLHIDELTVVSLIDSAALPEGGASYKSSSSCVIVIEPVKA